MRACPPSGRLLRSQSSRYSRVKVPGRVAVAQAQNASAEDLFVVTSRSIDVLHSEKMRDAHPVVRGHLIALLFDLYAAHWRLQFPMNRAHLLMPVPSYRLPSHN